MSWTAHVVTVQPAALPVAVADAQAHVRADEGGSDDTLLEGCIASAVGAVEAETGLKIITQTVKMTRARLDRHMPFLIGPIQSVSLTYLDPSAQLQTLDPSLYALVGAGTLNASIRLIPGKAWPAILDHPAAITCTAVTGYGADGSAVPGAITRALLLLVGDYYANREDTIAERSVTPATLPNGVSRLLANFRVW